MFPMMAGARVLLFLAAAVSVLLNRLCLQMGGGEFARVIRFHHRLCCDTLRDESGFCR